MRSPTILRWTALALVASVGLAFTAIPAEPRFTDARRQAEEFAGYATSILLTPEQEAIKREALSPIPAPCCADNGLDTCCCPCNLAKTAWGLANYLIARKGYGADQVRAKVEEWLRFVNPKGFSGNACYTPGGCNRAISANGCGGMREPVLP